MSRPATAVVVHGAHWPDAGRAAAVRDAVARITRGNVEVVMARDEASHPRGAAACVIDGVARTTAPVILVVDSTSPLDDAVLRPVLDAVRRSEVPADMAWAGPPLDDLLGAATGSDDILETLGRVARDPAPPGRDDPACWAIRQVAWQATGGLEVDWWSIGAVEDLARRAELAGRRCEAVGPVDAPTVSVSYPLHGDVRTVLAWRNPILTYLRALPEPVLAPALGLTIGRLLAAAWRATGVDAGSLAFGGDWGREGVSAVVRRLTGHPPRDGVWPRDEAGFAAPLVALHAVALQLPALVRTRQTLMTAARRDTATTGRASPSRGSGPVDGMAPREVATLPLEPCVSVVVVTWNGRQHLETCFTSILASDYPRDRLQVICVDNGSTDGTAAWMHERFPDVQLVALDDNRGFTGGNAAGVACATGDVLVFLNNDMRIEPALVSRLVAALAAGGGCAGARVMSWDGRRIDFVRGTSSFEVRGFQEHYQQRYVEGTVLAESFFPNGGAFAVTRRAYEEAGGFDPALFAYYDDVDLGWRLRTMGHTIRTVPDAVAYHRHGATARTQPGTHKRWLMARNALRVALRNYDAVTLPRMLPALLLLAGLRVAQDLRWRRTPEARRLRAWIAPPANPRPVTDAYRTSASDGQDSGVLTAWPIPEAAALGAVLTSLDEIAADRRAVQERRTTPDTAILPFLGRPFETLDGRSSYRSAQRALVELLALPRVIGLRPHVLIVTHEALRARMSGPAVRALEIGRALSDVARVTIAAPGPVEVQDHRVAFAPYDPSAPDALRAQADAADILLVQGFSLHSYPFLTRLVAPIVVDLYCPFTLEHLEQSRGTRSVDDPDLLREARAILDVQNAQLQHGDLFLAASERQRDFWTGALHTAGRINPRTLARDPALARLIRVVPFGLPDVAIAEFDAPARARRVAAGRPAGVLKGVHPAIGVHDKVLLWGGSLLDWQDPETLIEAVALLTAQRSDIRLFFMGVNHPNPQVAPMAVVQRCRDLANARGLLDTHVILNDWVPYEERGAYLMEADLGVSTHQAHLETRYAFRTRMLDYLWARLPIVCTEGDHFGELVRQRGLGRSVPPADPHALADAIAGLLDDPTAQAAARVALETAAREMTWSQVVAPLAEFCLAPEFAADRADRVERFHAALARSYQGTRLLKRMLLRLGVAEGDIESVKRLRPVRAMMTLRNHAAIWRARQRSERAR